MILSRVKLTTPKANAISSIRLLACLSIVICHYLQAYHSDWAYIFNTGVQVFFLISGFLYGAKGITDIHKFYWRRITKVYIPYLLWTLIVGGSLWLVGSELFDMHSFIKQILIVGRMPTQEHLWFITVLFACYLIVPLFSLFSKPISELISLIVFFILIILSYKYTQHIYCYWIATYFIGYVMGRFGKIQPLIVVFATLTFIWLIASLGTTNIASAFRDSEILHITFAIVFFYSLMLAFEILFSKTKLEKLPFPIGHFEFEMYLVHPIFIYGPFALLAITPFVPLNILAMTVAIIIATAIFIKLNKLISRWIGRVKPSTITHK